MPPHSTPLPRHQPQSYLAGYLTGLGILIIGGNRFFFSPVTQACQNQRLAAAASLSMAGKEGKPVLTFVSLASSSARRPLEASPRTALSLANFSAAKKKEIHPTTSRQRPAPPGTQKRTLLRNSKKTLPIPAPPRGEGYAQQATGHRLQATGYRLLHSLRSCRKSAETGFS